MEVYFLSPKEMGIYIGQTWRQIIIFLNSLNPTLAILH